MRSVLLIAAMLASHLVCPFDCMERTATSDEPAESAGGCSCCAPNGPRSEEPCEPDSDLPCCDCICDGAVLTAGVSIPADETSARHVEVSAAAVPAESALVAALQGRVDSGGRARPGRSWHLALQSLQI